MSEILDIYHASSSIDVLMQIARSIKTEQLNADQLTATAITSNSFAFDAKFDISNTAMRNLISKNRTIGIKLQTYINNHFRLYYKKNIQNRDV